MSSNNKNIDRRGFLKIFGGGAAALSLANCAPKTSSSASSSDESSLGEVPKDKMEYRTTTTKGDKLSLLGYGCMRWPLLKTPAEDGNIIDQEATNELVDYAIEHGVNYFDTAPPYLQGWCEKATGTALKRHPRDKYFIATKLSNANKAYWSREESLKMYYNSFKSLQVDYIDYMLLHTVGAGSWENFKARFLDNGILDFLIEEREAGRIRNLGFSFHGDIKVFEYLLDRHEEIGWDFAMIQLNYKDWNYADETSKNNTDARHLYEELAKHNIDVIIMEPLLGGRLANLPEHLSNMLKAEEPNDSLAKWAFRYAASHPKVITVLSGMAYKEHLQENIRTYSPLKWISEEENHLLMNVAKLMIEYPIIECTACQYCMPCPYGVDIPTIFTHYNKCISENRFPQSSQDKNYREARRAFLIGYDRKVEKLRQADHCIGCGECEEHCPQKLTIHKYLRQVNDYVESLKQETLE
ncbi:MAG: aldo/keto reductase [Rikenellaceae bacterium]